MNFIRFLSSLAVILILSLFLASVLGSWVIYLGVGAMIASFIATQIPLYTTCPTCQHRVWFRFVDKGVDCPGCKTRIVLKGGKQVKL